MTDHSSENNKFLFHTTILLTAARWWEWSRITLKEHTEKIMIEHKIPRLRMEREIAHTLKKMQDFLCGYDLWKRNQERKQAASCLKMAREYRNHARKLKKYLDAGLMISGNYRYIFVD